VLIPVRLACGCLGLKPDKSTTEHHPREDPAHSWANPAGGPASAPL